MQYLDMSIVSLELTAVHVYSEEGVNECGRNIFRLQQMSPSSA